MISLLEFISFSPGALLEIEFDRKEKIPIKASKNIFIFGNNASFVLRYCYKFQFPYRRKKANPGKSANFIRHKNVIQRRK